MSLGYQHDTNWLLSPFSKFLAFYYPDCLLYISLKIWGGFTFFQFNAVFVLNRCVYFQWKIINWMSHLVIFTFHSSISRLSFKSASFLTKSLSLRLKWPLKTSLWFNRLCALDCKTYHFTCWFILASVCESSFLQKLSLECQTLWKDRHADSRLCNRNVCEIHSN